MTLTELRAIRAEYKNSRDLSAKIDHDPAFKQELEDLYLEVFGKKLIRTCSNCWFDAFIELTHRPIEELMKKQECLFELKAGALLHDSDNTKMTTQKNITNELAIYHIKKNPSCVNMFSVIPSNLDELLSNVITKPVKPKVSKHEKTTPVKLEIEIVEEIEEPEQNKN